MTDIQQASGPTDFNNRYAEGRYERKPLTEMHPSEIVRLNEEWYKRVTSSRLHIERRTLLNISFFLGQQYVDFMGNLKSSKLIPQPERRGRVRTTENQIKPAVRREHARLLRNRPIGQVVPDGVDVNDLEAARAGDDILQHVFDETSYERRLSRAVLWTVFGGTSLFGVEWDTEKGRRVETPPDIPPEMQQQIQAMQQAGQQIPPEIAEQLQPTLEPEGDFRFRALSPFEFGVPQIRTEDLEEQPYVMVTKAYEIDEIEDRWGERVEPESRERFGVLDDRLTSILQTSLSGEDRTGGMRAEDHVPVAVVKETWIRPNEYLAPHGAVLVTTGDRILDLQPWPDYLKGQYPFRKMEHTEVPGSFWASSFIEDLIPIQRRHNRANSIVIENMNLQNQLAFAAPRGTNPRAMLGGKTVMFETPPGMQGTVQNIQVPPMGQLPILEIQHTREAFRELAFQHEVSKGTTPPNVRSGTAINALKESDDTASSMPLRSIELAVEHIGQLCLEMVKVFWNEERMIRVMGQDGEIERVAFIGGGDVGGHYTVERGSAWPYSKSEKVNMLVELAGIGAIAPEELLRYIDMGGARDVRRDREIDYRHARRENQRFEMAQPPQGQTGSPDIHAYIRGMLQIRPADWHNHMVHVSEHQKLMKSAKYEQWDLIKQQAFEAHVAGHMAGIQAQMANMQTGGAAPPVVEDEVAAGQPAEGQEQQGQQPQGGQTP